MGLTHTYDGTIESKRQLWGYLQSICRHIDTSSVVFEEGGRLEVTVLVFHEHMRIALLPGDTINLVALYEERETEHIQLTGV